ncbi:protoporphyrinogen oxidase HemJ [Sulfurimonas paralvinellae]|uniref:Protoporphyrinogen IX oxidase n=1 Tax=Sulfurimonas paralvinellae TaxID=317658 RepID=A0A7M1B5N8_9BACT|nr:protoporphyrinogen oxidase HemJ [Sulfurimonas paralvinellae]QOP45044.1 protoporphyrinogen oxidase HemJ [Sulfurimonas paralvinellae]
MLYNWILWFHVISFISWFAVLFYLPRLYVYHAEHSDNKGFIEVVKIQEMKLYKYIGVPSMWATIISGAVLIYLGDWMKAPWLHAKLLFLAFLIAYFYSLGVLRIKLLNDNCTKSGKFFRMYNEVPTILMLLIVAMVVFKPFS